MCSSSPDHATAKLLHIGSITTDCGTILQSCLQLASFCVQHSHIKGSVIGCNSFVANGCEIEESMLMGNDNYTNDKERARARAQGLSVIGIGMQGLTVLGSICVDLVALEVQTKLASQQPVS